MPIYYYQVGAILCKAGNASLNISNPLATMTGKQRGLGKNLVLQNPHFLLYQVDHQCNKLCIKVSSQMAQPSGHRFFAPHGTIKSGDWKHLAPEMRHVFDFTSPVGEEAVLQKIFEARARQEMTEVLCL